MCRICSITNKNAPYGVWNSPREKVLEDYEKIVRVEVLRPSQPNGIMSSAVTLPNYTLLGRLSSLSGKPCSIVHIPSPETDNCPSWISGRERMAVENIYANRQDIDQFNSCAVLLLVDKLSSIELVSERIVKDSLMSLLILVFADRVCSKPTVFYAMSHQRM